MATTKQKRVARLIIENSTAETPMTDIQILKSSNYSTITSETKSTKIIASEGVQEELMLAGFTEQNAKSVVSEILLNHYAKDTDRLKAAEQIFKVKGSYAAEKSVNVNVDIQRTPENEELETMRKEYEEKLRAKLHENTERN